MTNNERNEVLEEAARHLDRHLESDPPYGGLYAEKVRELKREEPANDLLITGEVARTVIKNAARLTQKFKGSPLWSLVSQITGHGCGNSIKICESANLDPNEIL